MPTPTSPGWIPSGIRLPRAVLYVPSAAGPTTGNPGYVLPEDANLATLGQDILAAMSAGTTVTVPVSSGLVTGSVVLNGAVLALAVLSPPEPGWQPA